MTFTQKEQTLLKDLLSHEQLCVEKYGKYAAQASDGGLKNLFSAIAQVETQHVNTLNQVMAGTVPSMNAGGGTKPTAPTQPAQYTPENRQADQYLCQDALSTEKYVSSAYNTSIFEFTNMDVRNCLNHLQKEEQEHGEQIYNFMAVNQMYQAQ